MERKEELEEDFIIEPSFFFLLPLGYFSLRH